MKFLIYTDLQATEGNERCRHDPTVPLQRYRVAKLFGQLGLMAREYGCESVCDLGDTTDDRSFVYRATLDVVTNGLSQLVDSLGGTRLGIKLTGNHEQLLKDGRIAAEGLFRPYFSHVGNGHVVLPHSVIVYRSFDEDYKSLNQDLEETHEMLSQRYPEKKAVLLAHGDVEGARYASGQKCEKGISLRVLDLFDVSLLGHVHNHQCLIKDKAWFIGSPFQQDFGEASQTKYVAVLDTGPRLSVKFVPTVGFPEYRTVSFKDFLTVASLEEEHRYSVLLSSIEETEQFYANPLSAVGEAQLNYSDSPGEDSGQGEEEISNDPRILLQRYMEARPLQGLPEELTEEILNLGMTFVTGD